MAELGVFIGVLGGVATSLILTFQKSKCETIKCCGCEIKRKVPEKDTPPDTPLPSPKP
jgi:hypothetical protein